MFQRLVSHNDDLARLVSVGYAVAFDTNHLVVRDIPYLDAAGDLNLGALVAKLVFIDQDRVQQDDHQVFFAGSQPHHLDGTPITGLGGGPAMIALSEASSDVVVERSFSNKRKVGNDLVAYSDFFDKIDSYVAIISGPATERYGTSPYTHRYVDTETADTIFKFRDTLTSRAEITELAARFENDVVAVIGLGGTGSYVLDFLVKTRVREIRGFDGDDFQVHNAFRAPGRTIDEEFGRPKAEVMQTRYENFRHGLSLRQSFIDATSVREMEDVTFAFVCVDKGSSRSGIFDLLIDRGIPFIDVGMGLKKKDSGLSGALRATHYSVADARVVRNLELAEMSDGPEDLYRANVQIAELNALNAALAVVKYKQLRGFYRQDGLGYHHIFDINELKTYDRGSDED